MKENQGQKKGFMRGPGRWVAVTVLVVAGGGVVLGSRYLRASGDNKQATVPTFVVAKGPLTISVTEAGTIKSRQQEILKSELEGMNVVLYLVPEGTRVKQGDLLVELDASKLQDQKVTQQITVQNAEAAYISATETLAVTESQAESDIAAADLAYKFAIQDLEKYVKGDYPKEINDAKAKIQLAEEERTRARDKAEWSQKLFDESYLSDSELQADKLAVSQKELQVKLAAGDLELLEKWTNKRKIAELESNVEQTKRALDRTKRKASADVTQAKATMLAKKLEFEHQKDQLEKTERMIAKAKIFAPIDGLVVYATTGGGGDRFRGNQEPLAEGSSVRERQELIYLPTADAVMAETKIHESSLDKVRLGLPARITVDAMPGKAYTGRVARIAQMPDPTSFFRNPDMKVFNTDVHIDGDGSELRTGMSCRVETVVDYYKEATYVPVQSVVRVNGKPTVWVKTPEGFKAREIEMGLDNNRMVRVISGVEADEEVMLSPPLAEATANTTDPGMPAGGIPVATTQPVAPMGGGRQGMRGEGGSPGGMREGGMREGGTQGGMRGEGTRGGGPGGAGPGGAGPSGAGGREGGAGGPGGAGGRGGRGGFGNMQNMTPEQREAAKAQMTPEQRARFEEFEKMSPEERQQRMQQFRQQRGGAGGEGGPGGGTRGPGGPGSN